jgi:hypothetical protein
VRGEDDEQVDASPMPPEFARELDALRRRAYGLGADIEDDPVALRRLARLEAALHEPQELSDPVLQAAVLRAPVQLKPPVRENRHPIPIGRIAATIVAILAVVWGADALLRPLSDDVLAASRATAQERQDLIDEVDLASFGMVGARLQPFAEYRDLSVWSAMSEAGLTCLLVRADGAGVFQVGCTPAPLEPSIDLTVGLDVHPHLVGDLPLGSVVRFVLRGDDVDVWVAEPSAVTDP